MSSETIATVREHYAKVAQGAATCCSPSTSCCGPSSSELGYEAADLAALPEGADLGLGCGNPQAIAAMRAGEMVVDLGSGAGIDCFLAARRVGQSGRVIGVDMTPEMIAKARANATKAGVENVEFRLGEIERLPVENSIADVVLSNCVVNLSPDKKSVFAEALRVLKPGGRLAIADVVATSALPEALAKNTAALTGCVAGAIEVSVLRALLEEVGFEDVQVRVNEQSRAVIAQWFPGTRAEEYVASAYIEGRRPATASACCSPGCCS